MNYLSLMFLGIAIIQGKKLTFIKLMLNGWICITIITSLKKIICLSHWKLPLKNSLFPRSSLILVTLIRTYLSYFPPYVFLTRNSFFILHLNSALSDRVSFLLSSAIIYHTAWSTLPQGLRHLDALLLTSLIPFILWQVHIDFCISKCIYILWDISKPLLSEPKLIHWTGLDPFCFPVI